MPTFGLTHQSLCSHLSPKGAILLYVYMLLQKPFPKGSDVLLTYMGPQQLLSFTLSPFHSPKQTFLTGQVADHDSYG